MEGILLLLVLFGAPVLIAIAVMKVGIPLFTGKTANQLAYEREVKRRSEQNEQAYYEGQLDRDAFEAFQHRQEKVERRRAQKRRR